MADLYEMFLGPLPESYCLYFQVITVFALIMIIIILLSGIASLFSKSKASLPMITGGLIGYVLIYLQNRILHTMCVKSI